MIDGSREKEEEKVLASRNHSTGYPMIGSIRKRSVSRCG
jgi:hypothetical protein